MTPRPTLGSLPHTGSFRGQPLAIMLAVLVVWIGVRAHLWSPPEGGAVSVAGTEMPGVDPEPMAFRPEERSRELPAWWSLATSSMVSKPKRGSAAYPMATLATLWREPSATFDPGPVARAMQLGGLPRASHPPIAEETRPSGPDRLQTHPPQAAFSLPPRPRRSSEPSRLSLDGWLFLRQGGVPNSGVPNSGAAPLAPTYGASQFGAVLRYDLGPRAVYRPQAYLRATAAIDSREAELAAGISIRPVPALPLRVHTEARLSRLGGRVELRPSAFVTAGIDEALPLGARVRGYAQAGYVGGAFATPFADGSLVVERDATRSERGRLALGVGAWGGAQEGTSRLDAGPTASMDMRLGKGSFRLAADYRIRVAGQAEPSSGAALTLSTSF